LSIHLAISSDRFYHLLFTIDRKKKRMEVEREHP